MTMAAARCGLTCGGPQIGEVPPLPANRRDPRRLHGRPHQGRRRRALRRHRRAPRHARQAVEDGLRQALHAALADPVIATADGGPLSLPGGKASPLTPDQQQAAASGEQDVFLASCSGFYSSPFARSPGEGCPVAAWGCLECPNAVFTERHLPSLTAFAAFTEDQREALDSTQWQARYGAAHHRLTTGIFPAFTRPSKPPPATTAPAASPCCQPASWRLT